MHFASGDLLRQMGAWKFCTLVNPWIPLSDGTKVRYTSLTPEHKQQTVDKLERYILETA
jgi:hypothetical protein